MPTMPIDKLSAKVVAAIIALLSVTLCMRCRNDCSSSGHTAWAHYGGDPDQSKYFNASEITKENVDSRQVPSRISSRPLHKDFER